MNSCESDASTPDNGSREGTSGAVFQKPRQGGTKLSQLLTRGPDVLRARTEILRT